MTRIIKHHPNAHIYYFTQNEFYELWELAKQRQSPKNNSHLVRDKRRVSMPNVKMHFIGLIGEYVFSIFAGIPFDNKSYLSGDKQKDFVYNGKRIEVKTLQGYLAFDVVNFDAEFCADEAILVTYETNHDKKISARVRLEGWITKNKFVQKRFIDDFGYGKRYCVQPDDLDDIKTILEATE